MIQDLFEEGYDEGFKNGVFCVTQLFKITLHKRVIQNDPIYVDEIIELLEKVQSDVLY